jgi:spore coat protein CotH
MKNYTLLFILISFSKLFGQGLPSESKFSNDLRQITTGSNQYEGLYDDRLVKEVKLYFEEANYWTTLAINYNSKTDLKAKMLYDGKLFNNVGVRFKGQTSYRGGPGGGVGSSQKKSFNISLDAFADLNIEGYKTLNLNNSYQDPSFMREVVYYNIIRRHSQAAKANFVRLYINDQDWGVYQNIQQLNKDFLEEWWPTNDGSNWRADTPTDFLGTPGNGPSWGDGKAAINYLGDSPSLYQQNYTLKSSGSNTPWEELALAAKILNQTPLSELESKGAKYFDWDKILWHIASEVLFSDDDSYIYKGKMDYYLYRDDVTGRISTFDYDGNSTFTNNNAGWGAFYNAEKVNYPLMNRLFQIPSLRQRYIHHLKTLINEYTSATALDPLLNTYKNLIDPLVEADPKKATTYAQFAPGVAALKTFLTNRKNNLLANTELSSIMPIITQTKYTTEQDWKAPQAGESVTVTASVSHSSSLSEVNLHYGIGLFQPFNKVSMNDNGANGDLKSNDGIYSAIIPGQKPQDFVKYYIEAKANDQNKTTAYFPIGAEHDIMVYQVEAQVSNTKDLVINEFMALNQTAIVDNNNENSDWLELFNTTNKDIDISGYHLSDNPLNFKKWQFPAGSSIKANGYLIVWCDEDKTQGPLHASFKLSGSGETIIVADRDGKLIDSTSFKNAIVDKSFARIPNGTGPFVQGNSTFAKNNSVVSGTQLIKETILKIWPNPASNYLSIRSNKPINVELISLSGQKFGGFNVADETTIDVSNYPAGLYFLRSLENNIYRKVVLY